MIRVIERDFSKSSQLVEELRDTNVQRRAPISALVTKHFNKGIGNSNSRLYKKLSRGLMSSEKLNLGSWVDLIIIWYETIGWFIKDPENPPNSITFCKGRNYQKLDLKLLRRKMESVVNYCLAV